MKPEADADDRNRCTDARTLAISVDQERQWNAIAQVTTRSVTAAAGRHMVGHIVRWRDVRSVTYRAVRNAVFSV
ncbi:hypothetical protein [Salinisphaera sp. T31B1]|uniref:hypothetical protein n=1 Tax=Salinisphaera sp. T31B1 TaxID=727963 RepID=UPI00333ED7E1